MNYKKFIHQDTDGNPWAIVTAEQLWANVYAIKFNRPERFLMPEEWQHLFHQAKESALQFGAESLLSRVRLDYEPEVFRSILGSIGFHKSSGRIEYQLSVDQLPVQRGSPILWKTAEELSWKLEDIVQFTFRVTRLALDVDPEEKIEDFVQDWLTHDELSSGPEFINIGFIAHQPVALSVVQINNESGWSRISYMGLIPEFRSQGLGKWVHQQGFQKMKDQGGKTYHGGTHCDNFSMRKLFESHGCKVSSEMEEWTCNLKRDQNEV